MSLPNLHEKSSAAAKTVSRMCCVIIAVSGVFFVSILVALFFQSISYISGPSIDSKLLQNKIKEYQKNTKNTQLSEEIRALILLSRDNFFYQKSFVQTCSRLLAIGFVLFFSALAFYLKQWDASPTVDYRLPVMQQMALSQKAMIGLSISILFVSILFALIIFSIFGILRLPVYTLI